MQITLDNVGKRFNHEWIFRRIAHEFNSGRSYAITGPNGSGKSTLLQVIAGSLTHNEGEISFIDSQKKIALEKHFNRIAIAAPYLELVEEMTANEFLNFHASFKSLTKSNDEIISVVGLQKAAEKQIRYYSSGMKQRLKLAQAFFSDAPVLLLDEPTTNLDVEGISLYQELIKNYTENRLVIVSSNDKQEYGFCEQVIDINKFKS